MQAMTISDASNPSARPDVSASATPSDAARVYLDYTQAELDRAYDQRAWVADVDEINRAYADESAAVRADLKHFEKHYGPGDDDTLDVFPAGVTTYANAASPIHVHLHGGSWRFHGKHDVSFIAPVFVAAGAAFVAPNFSLIPKVRLPEMIAQLRRAIAWVYANAASFGGDANNIHLSGHSSGAHLAGVLLTTDWTALGLPADVIKSGLLVSGMYDLRPVMLSARSSYVKLTADEIGALSAILHIERINAPILLANGTAETPEFQRQPQAFAAALRAAGKRVESMVVDGANHFAILHGLADAETPLARAALALAGLAR